MDPKYGTQHTSNLILLSPEVPYDLIKCRKPCPSNLRIIFPTLTENTSAVSILPGFIEVLGRKIDSAEDLVAPSMHLQ